MNPPSTIYETLCGKLGLTLRNRKSKAMGTQFGRRLRMESLETRELLVITVNTTVDELDGSIQDDVSLRDAIDLAPTGETINFDSSLNGATITLLQNLGEIEIDSDLTIDASMLSLGITIDAGNGPDHMPNTGDGFRIFDITDPTFGSDPPSVTMIGLTLAGGDELSDGGAIQAVGDVSLTLDSVTIRDSSTLTGRGGQIEREHLPSGGLLAQAA